MIAIGKQQFDVILLDLGMPDLNGNEVLRFVADRAADTPVIVVSGSTRNIMQRYGIDTIQVPGADASLSKPFKGADLVAQVKELLESRT